MHMGMGGRCDVERMAPESGLMRRGAEDKGREEELGVP
jgi:hypothetical protein